ATTNPVITSTVTSNTRRATRGKKNTGKTNKGKNPATEPVTVRPAVPVPGHAIPSAEPTEQAAEPSFVLDQATIQSKISESEEVSALLSNIFTEDAVTDSPLPPASSSDAVAPSPVSIDSGSTIDSLTAIAGLDTAHSLLLQAMAERESWMRVELEAIATSLNLMLDGALELINEAAFDRCDEPLLEGDDPIELNPDVLQELLA
ncbi:MAG: hypothetical protein MUF49_15360, partial [Oculatellaceae cyanobacterium Prado106]|nr:hypothetical protein [Oculatellaceae cyanobacterium Prado106]